MAETPGTTRLPTMPANADPNDSLKVIDRWIRDTVAPYVTYTPVITGTSGGFTLGAGATLLGRYKRAGCRCNVEIRIFFGNPGFVAGGNTPWSISLPVLPVLADLPVQWGNKRLGGVYISTGVVQDDHSAFAHRVGPGGAILRDFEVLISGAAAGQRLTGTIPGIGSGGSLFADLSYECAP